MVNFAKEYIKPENCVLGFGIPVTKAEFLAGRVHPDKDFAKLFKGGWNHYNYEFIRILEHVSPQLRATGVQLVFNLSLKDFEQLFSYEKTKVVILFSHWTEAEEQVELSDGMVGIHELVRRIPTHFCGIIDLCVCHPQKLPQLIRKERSNCLVKYTKREATPYLWMYFYLAMFRYLKNNKLTYLKAIEDLTVEIFRR